jgi:hypothetical protein
VTAAGGRFLRVCQTLGQFVREPPVSGSQSPAVKPGEESELGLESAARMLAMRLQCETPPALGITRRARPLLARPHRTSTSSES